MLISKCILQHVPHIHAIGDIVGQPMLAHKGVHEGHVAAEVISGQEALLRPESDSINCLH